MVKIVGSTNFFGKLHDLFTFVFIEGEEVQKCDMRRYKNYIHLLYLHKIIKIVGLILY